MLLKILMGEVRSRHFENAETIGIVGESSRSFGFLNGKWIPRPSKQHAGPRHLQQERAGGGQSSRPGLGSSNRPGVGFVSLWNHHDINTYPQKQTSHGDVFTSRLDMLAMLHAFGSESVPGAEKFDY